MGRQKVRYPGPFGQRPGYRLREIRTVVRTATPARLVPAELCGRLLPVLHEHRPFMLSDGEEPHKSQRRTEREPQD